MMRGVPRGVVRDMFKRLRAAAALGAPIDDMVLIIYTLVVVRLRAAAASGVPDMLDELMVVVVRPRAAAASGVPNMLYELMVVVVWW